MPTAYVTAPTDAAADIATALVEERLAACVNRVPCRSTYRWEGEVVEDDEELLLVKTTDERFADLEARILALHPYDVPCIERFEEGSIHAPFEAWIAESVS
ncbi:divalent-cation tolerance protein CutA [Halobacteriales archaeon Cl-PHB]